jgi:hypothetical protein
MTPSRARIAVVVLVGLAIVGWLRLRSDDRDGAAPATSSSHRAMSPALAEALAKARRATAFALPALHTDGMVRISGSVIDQLTHETVAGVEVVFRGPFGESTTTAATDGTYSIELASGVYRAFVRDERMLSVGHADRVRLPVGPRVETAGVPDEALMPLVVASADTDHVELGVIRGGVVVGQVVDRNGRAIAHAVVRARGNETRPALGTDVVEADGEGNFELHVPPGRYVLDASHPVYAGLPDPEGFAIDPGQTLKKRVTMTAGCIISGRVLLADGTPAADGAIEKQFVDLDNEVGPSGRIEPDGTFRWITTEEGDVTLRVWPWKSPPSQFRQFACRDGARFSDVVFKLPSRSPVLEGVLVDATGAPVPFAYLDLQPRDLGGQGQQERTDAEGRWHVYDMPAGHYEVEAQSTGRGVVKTEIVVPSRDVRLQLGGVGRIEGTTTDLVDGTIEVTFRGCAGVASISHEPHVVMVAAGRFSIDDAPACQLQLMASWHGRSSAFEADVVSADTTQVEVAIGPPRPKTIHGTVRDRESRPITGAIVRTSGSEEESTVIARTDGTGRYTLAAYSGAHIIAMEGERAGYALAGRANVDDEEVDIVVDSYDQ